MAADRWKRLSALYHEAANRESHDRAAYLAVACADDPQLLSEIESMFTGEMPSVAALEAMATELAQAEAQPAVGARLGPYELSALIGEGGMGQVYRARDTELHRDVAIKILPPVFALNEDRRARFEREARVLAALSHPNIGAIFGLAEGDGLRGIVLELVPGDTLADRIQTSGRGRSGARGLPIADVLAFAQQIGQALEAAHERGIVHRDLKPANIKITADGTIKVLDFGLAKVNDGAERDALATSSETAPALDTRAGTMVGTPAYMSPEQALQKGADKRADVWAFGCVLYEMLTGQPAFERATVQETLAAIVHETTDLTILPVTPPRIVELLRRCLDKDPRRRLRDIGEAVIAIDDVLSAPADSQGTRSRWRVPPRTLWASAAMLIALAGMWYVARSPQLDTELQWMAIPVPPDAPPAALLGVALSGDGKQMAYIAQQSGTRRLVVRSLGAPERRVLDGTDDASFPFFSPDGVWIGFFAQGKLKKVPASGGSVTTIVPNVDGGPAAWGEGDDIYYANGAILRVAAAEGGRPQRVTDVDDSKGEIRHYYPVILPGSQALVYTIWRGPGWDEKDIVVQRLGSVTKQLLVRGASTAKYVPTGHLVYSRAGTLTGIRFDLSRLVTIGAPAKLLDDVREGTRNADYDVSSAGSIAYVGQSPAAYDRIPVIVDRSGTATTLPGLRPAYYQSPRFSPDGSLLALTATDALVDIFVYDFQRKSRTRLTTEGSSQDPVWSSDGSRIAYRATRGPATRNIWWRPADGSSGEERLTEGGRTQTPWSASPDGAVLTFNQTSRETGSDVWLLPLTSDRRPRPLIREKEDEFRAEISPGGRCLAFVSNRPGPLQVYVTSYPELKWRTQVSTDGGDEPRWARSGRELFYRFGSQLMAVSIDTGSCRPSPPRPLDIAGDYIFGAPTIDYDVHPDGKQFVMIRPSQPDPPVTHINLLLNWFEVLKARLPQ